MPKLNTEPYFYIDTRTLLAQCVVRADQYEQLKESLDLFARANVKDIVFLDFHSEVGNPELLAILTNILGEEIAKKCNGLFILFTVKDSSFFGT